MYAVTEAQGEQRSRADPQPASSESDERWHLLSSEEALERLESSRDGLSDDDAQSRLDEYGPNSLRQDQSTSWLTILLMQFKSPLIYVLLGALVVTLVIREWGDATVIGFVLILNTIIGFTQEYRAETTIRALMEIVSPDAHVRRDGEEQAIPSDQVVPGDVVLLREGEVVPADVRLIEAKGLQLNEAALTGESVPANKSAATMEGSEEDLPPAEIKNLAYMGTAVTAGSGSGVVITTGTNTQVGGIAESVRSAGENKTPLQVRIDRLARWIALWIVLLAVIAGGIGLLMGNSWTEMFTLAVALAVAAMPAGLPVVMTVALAIGVRRMAHRHALIRKLPAVETLGSTTVIVSDKTGTLTRNQMTTRRIRTASAAFRIVGRPLEPSGRVLSLPDGDAAAGEPADSEGDANQDVQAEEVEVRAGSALHTTLLVGVLNNNATLHDQSADSGSDDEQQDDSTDDRAQIRARGARSDAGSIDIENNDGSTEEANTEEPEWEETDASRAAGDPMDIAMLIAGARVGIERKAMLDRYPEIDSVPFETERKFSATIHDSPDGGGPLVCIKGAPEVILDMCDRQLDDNDDTEGVEGAIDREALRDAAGLLASEGLRVLGMAVGRGDEASERIASDNPGGMTFAGFQGLMDPPRDEAIQAVDDCHEAGIRVVMVTGDHARTAEAIGRKIHINDHPRFRKSLDALADASDRSHDRETDASHAVEGKDIDDLDGDALGERIRSSNIFARFTPEQKLRLVRRLREDGQIVAVTGDGVNDAPALKEADIGAAMGKTGTDVAKEASDMVITDDNFASVYAAVQEGRTAFRNIRMATFFLLSTGAADVLIILTALAAGWALPLLPAQILWGNVVTNGIQDVALGFEPGERALAQRPPRPPKEGVLDRTLLWRLVIIGIWMAIGVIGVFAWQRFHREADLATARTATLTTLVLFQMVHVFNCRSEDVSLWKKSVLTNRVLFIGVIVSLVVHIAALYIPWTQQLLDITPIDGTTWIVSLAIALTIIIPNEFHKAMTRKARSRSVRDES